VIVQELPGGKVEVAAIDPVASMAAVKNTKLGEVGKEVSAKLKAVIDNL
jgi:2-methylaconitate cis-trans-isomerase PrpF